MRVCILIDAWEPVWGGGQTHVWEIANRLIKNYGYEIDIYTRKLTGDLNKNFIRNENYLNNKLRIYRIGPLSNFYNVLGRSSWILSAVFAIYKNHLKRKYSLIHAHAYTAGIPAKILSLLIKLPVVFTVHGCNNLDLGKVNLTTVVEKILLTKIKYDTEISVSRNFLKYPNVNKQIEIIPNGVNVDAFNKEKIRKYKSRFFKILWVGRYDKIKGLDILVKAFSQTLKIDNRFRLILVGDGQEKNNIKRSINSLNIDNSVRMMGKKKFKEIIKIYKLADIFVLPSLSEGQPITILEAWAANLPVIATKVGDNKYYIKNNHNGYLIKPNCIYCLTEAIIKAADNKNLMQMGKSGYRLVKKYYSWEITARKIHRIYQKFI